MKKTLRIVDKRPVKPLKIETDKHMLAERKQLVELLVLEAKNTPCEYWPQRIPRIHPTAKGFKIAWNKISPTIGQVSVVCLKTGLTNDAKQFVSIVGDVLHDELEL